MAIIPQPLSLLHGPGGLQLDPSTLITYNEEQILVVATLLQERLRCQLGLSLRVQQAAVPSTPSLHLQLCAVVEELSSHPQGEEGYVLTVTASSGAVVAAASRQGLLYGAQSLAQLLLPVATAGGAAAASEQQQQQQQFYLPAVRVVDAPRFRWRGLMLDCGRHFLSVPFILRVLDLMLLYRFNRLHWHLCEDQGWRLEVKQFPRLTEVGAWREGAEDKQRYGGYYTQEQVAEVVAYAAARGIMVVPEIEMPGHCVAALASYPNLSCSGDVKEVSSHWGVHEDVYCAGNEEVFAFLEGVLQEVFRLFPSPYIHVGGDEVPKTMWSQCPKCQRRISEEGLADVDQLQAWFVARINAFLRSHGRQLVGWDEILEGGLCEGATVMSWRGMAGGVAAARAGHDVVMTPTASCYFDYRQSGEGQEPGAWYAVLTLRQVYDFDPIPPEPPATAQPNGGAGTRQGRPASTEPMALDGGGEEGEGPSGCAAEPAASGAAASGAGAEEEGVEGRELGGLAYTVPPPPRPLPLPGEPGGGEGGPEAEEEGAAGSPGWRGQQEELRQAGLTLTPQEAAHILGGQANLWTEYVPTEEVAMYMLVPRMCAMAEALWSPRAAKGWAGFERRLRAHEGLWQRMGVRYRPVEGEEGGVSGEGGV